MGQIIAVMPASGGVGATSLAAAIAVRAAAAHRSVVAVDLDPWSGGLDVTFGVEQEPGWRWDRLHEVDGVVDGLRLGERLPRMLDVAVLGMPLTRGEGTVRRGEGALTPMALEPAPWVARIRDVVLGLAEAHEVVVLDLSRDERVLGEVVPHVDALVVVVGARTAELAAAAAAVPALQSLGADPWVVLRGPGASHVEDLVVDELDVEVVATLADDHRVVSEVAEGIPPGYRGRGPIVSVADRLLLRLVEVEDELRRTA